MITILAVLVAVAVLVVILWMTQGSGGRRRSVELGEKGPSTVQSWKGLVKVSSLGWLEVAQHQKLGELLQVSGQTIGAVPFQLIFQIEADKQFGLIYVRLGTSIVRSEGGQRSLKSAKPNESLCVQAGLDEGVDVHESRLATEDPAALIGHGAFELVLSNVNSLTTGQAVHLAVKCDQMSVSFVKTWDIPSRHSDEALLAQMSVNADVTHLEERIKDVQPADRVSALMRGHGEYPVLSSGVCYVLGNWGGNELNFRMDQEVAILVVESFDPSLSLVGFLKNLTLEPVMHSRLLWCPTEHTGLEQVVLIAPDLGAKAHKVVDLVRQNALMVLPAGEGQAVEVLKVMSHGPETGEVRHVSLHYLRSDQFKNILVWTLPAAI